VYTEIMLCSKG